MDAEAEDRKQRVAAGQATMARWLRGGVLSPQAQAELAEREAERRLQEMRDAETERVQKLMREAADKKRAFEALLPERRRRHIEAVEAFRARLDAAPAIKRAKRVVDLTGVEPATNWRTPQDEYLTILTERV